MKKHPNLVFRKECEIALIIAASSVTPVRYVC